LIHLTLGLSLRVNLEEILFGGKIFTLFVKGLYIGHVEWFDNNKFRMVGGDQNMIRGGFT